MTKDGTHYHVKTYLIDEDGNREDFENYLPCIKDYLDALLVAADWTQLQRSVYGSQMEDGDTDYPVQDPSQSRDGIYSSHVKDGSGVLAEVVEVDDDDRIDEAFLNAMASYLGATVISFEDGIGVLEFLPDPKTWENLPVH